MKDIVNVHTFLIRFVGHNSIVNIYKEIIDDEGAHQYKFLWRGMDWECSQNEEDVAYMKKREIAPCPYSFANVIKIKNFPKRDVCDEVDLIVEELTSNEAEI